MMKIVKLIYVITVMYMMVILTDDIHNTFVSECAFIVERTMIC